MHFFTFEVRYSSLTFFYAMNLHLTKLVSLSVLQIADEVGAETCSVVDL